MNTTPDTLKSLAKEFFHILLNPDECIGSTVVEVDFPHSLGKKMQKIFARCSTPAYSFDMPSQRHRDKTTFSITMPREMHMQLKQLAKKEGKTVTELVNLWAFEKTQNISLSPEDHEQIAREIRAWEARQSGKSSD